MPSLFRNRSVCLLLTVMLLHRVSTSQTLVCHPAYESATGYSDYFKMREAAVTAPYRPIFHP